MSPFSLVDQSNLKERIHRLEHPDAFGAEKIDTPNLAAAEQNRSVQTSGFPTLLAAIITGMTIWLLLLVLYEILLFPL